MCKIMLLSDSPFPRKEAVQYSVELAKRMNSKLIFLSLIPFEATEGGAKEIESIAGMGKRAMDVLKKFSEAYQAADPIIETSVKIGDPRSELVKFLAESGTFETIVWGGRPDLICQKSHWLARIKKMIKCSVVIPVPKKRTGHRNMGSSR